MLRWGLKQKMVLYFGKKVLDLIKFHKLFFMNMNSTNLYSERSMIVTTLIPDKSTLTIQYNTLYFPTFAFIVFTYFHTQLYIATR